MAGLTILYTKLLHKPQDHLFFKKKKTRDALYQSLKNQFLRSMSKPSVYLGPIWSQLNLATHGLLLGIITVWRRMQFVQHSTDLQADLVQGQIHRLCETLLDMPSLRQSLSRPPPHARIRACHTCALLHRLRTSRHAFQRGEGRPTPHPV